ncbi:MAG: acetyltransferase [Cyclobacteriaceae bacterium]|nr:acetyltransferase [Cyclobacteriaceae bacterium]
MTTFRKKICILGFGGFGRETLCCLMDTLPSETKIEDVACFMGPDEHIKEKKILGADVIPLSQFDPAKYDVVIAIGDPQIRKKMVEALPANTTFATIIHPTVVKSKWVEIGEGSIITAGVILTCNIKIGKHAHLNLHTTIGHDCNIGDFFTTTPAVNISGNCTFGDFVYFGTNASVREKITICSNVTIGMGGVVVKSIDTEGVYVGNPLKRMEKKA